ncbi:hypothetical protein JCM11641_004892 [Rhodosporidiobolus odoratus]
MALDAWIRQLDYAVPDHPVALVQLSPTQLANTSLRPEVPVFIRQRAYHLFLEHRAAYTGGKGKSREQPLFEAVLDFAVPSDVGNLSPTQLLLVQFNQRCTSPTLAEEAASSFTLLAHHRRNAEVDLPGTQGMEERRGLLRVTADTMQVLSGKNGRVKVRVKSSDIMAFCYLAGADDGNGRMECTLFLDVSKLSLFNQAYSAGAIRICLGMLRSEDPTFAGLRALIGEWSEENQFEVELRRRIGTLTS